jgi:hypothetical protein
VWGVLLVVASFRRRRAEKEQQYHLTFLHIKVPKDNEIEVKVAENMFASLMGFKKSFWKSLFAGQYRISFEIVSKSTGIGFYVVVPDDIATLVEKQVNAAYPSAEIDIVDPQEIWDRGEFTQVAELKLKGPNYYPIMGYEDMKNDSISGITSSISKMKDDEVCAIQYIIQPSGDAWRLAGRSFISRIKTASANPEKKTNIDTSFLEAVEKKISHPGFYTKIRLVSIAKDKFTAQGHIQNMTTAFEQFTDISYNRFVKRRFVPSRKLVDDFIYRRIEIVDIHLPIVGVQLFSNVSVLNTVELATVFHMPNKNIETPSILWLTSRRSAAPTNLPESGLYLGKSVFRGIEKKVFMQLPDRERHLYIIGQTGTGKSVFMKWLALQDIRNGEGLAMIDPHGTDIDDLLPQIPPERMKDVILWDVADTERPMGMNMLEHHTEEEKHLIVNAFIALLYKLYDPNHQGIMGPQLERAIRNVMLTAMVDPEATMVDVLRLLIDKDYCKKFLDKLTDPLVKRYWTDEVAHTSEARKSETMGYFVSKFDRFVTERLMRNIVGQPKSAFDLNEIMANKKILLVDLAKGKIGEENSTFLGLLLVPRILAAAFNRQSLNQANFPDFFLYVDEFQNFATPDFATILSEARKYKLDLIVGHQFISQLDDDIKNAIFGNVGSMCTFRVSADDAEYLKNHFGPTFTESDLMNLPMFNSYMRLLVNGQPTPPFSMLVDTQAAFNQPKDKNIEAQIREHSRMTYGKPIDEVEKYINDRMAMNVEPELPPLPQIPGLGKGRIPF